LYNGAQINEMQETLKKQKQAENEAASQGQQVLLSES
jgi:hypothetical protein